MAVEPLLTSQEVAELLRKDRTTVERWSKIHEANEKFGLRGIRCGAGWRYDRATVERAMREGVKLPRRGRPRK